MKTWFITGIARGLGKALAEAVLARGDTVIGTTRDGFAEIAPSPGTFHVLPLDLADPNAGAGVVEQAFMLCGHIDVLANNAGYGLLGAIEEASDDEIEHLFAVNVFGPSRLIRAFLPRLRTQGSGHIVNITSIAGRAPMASSGFYAAAKAAMEGLSESLAQEVAPLGIRVTAIAPGGFRTDFLSKHSIQRSNSAIADAYVGTVGKALGHLDAMAGRQIGDPVRAAKAIIATVYAEEPPRHLLLGSDALGRTREQLAATTREIDAWEATTLATDFH